MVERFVELRRGWPDLFFASHLLPRGKRVAVRTLASVLRQLTAIMGVTANDAPVTEGGGCCAEESPQRRAQVCRAVLDHLYTGEPTGRGDIDGLARIAANGVLPREPLERFIDALAERVTLRRYATWARLRQQLHQTAGAAALLMARLLDGGAAPFPATRAEQWRAWGTGLALIDLLCRVGADWRQGRLLVPLDDLVPLGISDRQVALAATEPGHQPPPRWHELLTFERQRIESLLTGGAMAIKALDAPHARRFALLLAQTQRRRLDALAASPAAGFAAPFRSTAALRWGALPILLRRGG